MVVCIPLHLDLLNTLFSSDEVVNLTSENHDPCTREVTYTKEENKNTLQKAPVWSRPNTFQRLS